MQQAPFPLLLSVLLLSTTAFVSRGADIACAEHLALAKKWLPLNADSALFHALEAEKCMGDLEHQLKNVCACSSPWVMHNKPCAICP
jgi:hypothetical protein